MEPRANKIKKKLSRLGAYNLSFKYFYLIGCAALVFLDEVFCKLDVGAHDTARALKTTNSRMPFYFHYEEFDLFDTSDLYKGKG